MSLSEDVAPYVGRSETSSDVVDPERLTRLAALLDRMWTPADPLPALAHFVLFRPDHPQSRIGLDGHPMRDAAGMLPDIELPRRMWAGSRIAFHQGLKVGQVVDRKSTLTKAVAKSGGSGSLVFCTVAHEICDRSKGDLLISEKQDLVYREAHSGSDMAPRASPDPDFVPAYTVAKTFDPVELFRYSALTFNSHRIHYDREYARREEGYQGLVVHGPLLATLLFDHLQQVAEGRRVREFSFRAVSPSFDNEQLTLGVSFDGDEAQLCVINPVGLALTGEARVE